MLTTALKHLNDRRDRAEEIGEDAGFTLIELMVVLLIMAILLAIAIPTFLGVSGSANDRAAQSNLNTALTNAKSYYQNNNQSYDAAANVTAALTTQEPSLTWTTGNSTTSGDISVATATDGNAVALAALSKTGVCWYLVSNEATEAAANWTGGGTTDNPQYGSGTWYGAAHVGSTGACSAAAIPASGTTAGATHWNAAGSSGFPTAPAS